MGLRHASLFDAATAGALISQWLAEHSRVAPVKREAVLAAGSFDSRFRVAEDWGPRAAIEPQGILRALPPGSARHRPASSFYVADEITKLFRRAAPRVYGITILGSLRAGEKESVHPSIAALRAAIADDEVYMCRRAIFAGRHCLSNAILDAGDNPLGRFEFHTDEWAV
jgi:hypothetical protein